MIAWIFSLFVDGCRRVGRVYRLQPCLCCLRRLHRSSSEDANYLGFLWTLEHQDWDAKQAGRG